MAKTTEAQVAPETTKTTEQGTEWSETRTIFLPRGTAREQNFILVGVNGKRYQVPRGKSIEVPLPIYERLMIMQEAQEKAYELRKAVQDETDNATLKRVQ